MNVKFEWEIRLACTSERCSTSIWQFVAAVLNIYSRLCFFVSQQVLLSVCVSCKRACADVYIHIWASTRRTCWCACMFIRFHFVCDVPHVCTPCSCVCMLAQLFPLRVRTWVVFGGDKYTGGTLSAATQTQAGWMPALKRGLYLCMCVTLRIWIKGREAGEGLSMYGGFASREKGNYMRAHRR